LGHFGGSRFGADLRRLTFAHNEIRSSPPSFRAALTGQRRG
jgi:hypothetical protein